MNTGNFNFLRRTEETVDARIKVRLSNLVTIDVMKKLQEEIYKEGLRPTRLCGADIVKFSFVFKESTEVFLFCVVFSQNTRK